jgi:hypothetical protein
MGWKLQRMRGLESVMIITVQIPGHIGRNRLMLNGRYGIGVCVPPFVQEVSGFANHWVFGLLTILIGPGILPLITVSYINEEIISGLYITCLSADNDNQPFKEQDTHVILRRVHDTRT